MKKLLGVVVVLLLAWFALASKNIDPVKTLGRDSQQFASYMNEINFDGVASMTHPKIVKAAGGESNAAIMIKKLLSENPLGGSFKNMNFKTPNSIVSIKNNLGAVVPYDVLLEVNGKQAVMESFYIAWSDNEGEKWYFADGSRVNQRALEALFLGYSGQLVLPKKTLPYEVVQ